MGKTFIRRGLSGDPQAAIGAALTVYHRERGAFPPSIVVNRKRVDDARAVVGAVAAAQTKAGRAALGTLVETSGGALLNEVWLQVI